MKVALHARVSSEEQRRGRNIESQIAELLQHASACNYEIAGRYLEDGWSGGETLERPEMDRLRDDARAGKFEAILCYHPDRLSRVQLQQLLLLDEFERLGIKVIFTTQPGLDEQSPESRLITQTVLALNSQLERMRILERTRRGRLHKARSGHVVTSRPPYGFNYIPGLANKEKPGHFVHNQKEIQTVKLILGWAKDGTSDREIIRRLKDKDIKPRSGSDVWARSTICKILSTHLDYYSGTWNYLKYEQCEAKNPRSKEKYRKHQKTSRKLRDRNEWIQVAIPELAIISTEEVELIKKRRQANRTKNPGNCKNFYLLRQMVYHDTCHRMCYADSYHQRAFYRCSDKKNHSLNPNACQGESIKAETLETAIWNDIQNLIFNPATFKEQAQNFVSRNQDDGVFRNTQLVELTKKQIGLEREQERLTDAFREGVIDLAELKIQKEKIAVKKTQFEEAEQEILKNRKKVGEISVDSLLTDIDQLCQDLQTVMGSLVNQERHQLLKWMGVKVTFGDFRYNIDGYLPYINHYAQSRPQYPDNMSGIWHAQKMPELVIPFSLCGVLPKYINQHNIIWPTL